MKYFENLGESRRRGSGDTISGSLDGAADIPPVPSMSVPSASRTAVKQERYGDFDL